MMSKVSANSMQNRRPDKRPLVITRSTYIGAGSYVGHWLGDNVSAWDQYLASIRHFLQFAAFFQVPMVSLHLWSRSLRKDTKKTRSELMSAASLATLPKTFAPVGLLLGLSIRSTETTTLQAPGLRNSTDGSPLLRPRAKQLTFDTDF